MSKKTYNKRSSISKNQIKTNTTTQFPSATKVIVTGSECSVLSYDEDDRNLIYSRYMSIISEGIRKWNELKVASSCDAQKTDETENPNENVPKSTAEQQRMNTFDDVNSAKAIVNENTTNRMQMRSHRAGVQSIHKTKQQPRRSSAVETNRRMKEQIISASPRKLARVDKPSSKRRRRIRKKPQKPHTIVTRQQSNSLREQAMKLKHILFEDYHATSPSSNVDETNEKP